MPGAQGCHLGLESPCLPLQLGERNLALGQVVGQFVESPCLLVGQDLPSRQCRLVFGQLNLLGAKLRLGLGAPYQRFLPCRHLRLQAQGLPLPRGGGGNALDLLRPGMAGLVEPGAHLEGEPQAAAGAGHAREHHR